MKLEYAFNLIIPQVNDNSIGSEQLLAKTQIKFPTVKCPQKLRQILNFQIIYLVFSRERSVAITFVRTNVPYRYYNVGR